MPPVDIPVVLMALRARCPNCHSRSARLTVPAAPTVQTFRCNDCGVGWNVWVTDELQPFARVPWTCPICGSGDITFVERIAAAVLCRCFDCDGAFTVPLESNPAAAG